jgi:mRNA-degrading endonuclease RelE of RelBE toxin-antitoxin system
VRTRRLALRFEAKVLKQLRHMPPHDVERVLAALEGIRDWPPEIGDVRALAGEFRGLCRLRVGPWRVHLDVDLAAAVLNVLSIAPRQRAY